jgi:hypothetical protein
MTDNASVDVAYDGDKLYVITETVFIREVDPLTLIKIGKRIRINDFCPLITAT